MIKSKHIKKFTICFEKEAYCAKNEIYGVILYETL